jgi:hypothetical protein
VLISAFSLSSIAQHDALMNNEPKLAGIARTNSPLDGGCREHRMVYQLKAFAFSPWKERVIGLLSLPGENDIEVTVYLKGIQFEGTFF